MKNKATIVLILLGDDIKGFICLKRAEIQLEMRSKQLI